MGKITRSLIKFSRDSAEIRPRLPMCRHAWPRSGEIIYDFIKKIIDISPRSPDRSSNFGRDLAEIAYVSTRPDIFRLDFRCHVDLCFGRVSSLSSHTLILLPRTVRQERIGSYGAEKPHDPHLGPLMQFCCQGPISPISQFALAGLVHSIGTLNPIHMQPPVQNKAIVRPLKRCG